MRKSILIMTALSTFSVAPAHAQQTVSQEVRVNTVDLASPAGRARLERRIRAALETVCGSYAGASVQEMSAIDRCRATARAAVETRLAELRTRAANRQLVSR